MDAKFKRTRLITGDAVQLKYLIIVMFSMLVPLVVFGGAFYFLVYSLMSGEVGASDYFSTNILPALNKISLILLLGFPPLVLMIFFWAAILSNRFAGPLKRLENEICKIADTGDMKKRVKIREHDDIGGLVDAINRLIAKADEEITK